MTRIRRHDATVDWQVHKSGWRLSVDGDGSQFHLFCEDGHESVVSSDKLSKRLRDAVLPGSKK